MSRFTVKKGKSPSGYWILDTHKNELTIRCRLKREAQKTADEWNAEHAEECAKVSEQNYLADRPELRRASFKLIQGGAA